jgi:hypothetical protein
MTALTKRQFRLLLAIYCIVGVLSIIWKIPGRKHLTLADVALAKSRFGLETWSDYDFAVLMIWLLGTLIVAWLIGLMFTFLIWREGLYILLAAVCGRLVYSFIRYDHFTPEFFGIATLFLEAVIIITGLFGPAKHLFQKQYEARV